MADEAKLYLECLDAYEIAKAKAPLDDFRVSGSTALRENDAELAAMALGILPSFGSDLVFQQGGTGNKKKTVIRTTLFAMTSGKQDLVPGVRKLAEKLAKRSTNGGIPNVIVKAIKEALFGPWRYEDREHPLGWDPQVQRLHALRNKAPADDQEKRSVFGAVFLASQALPLFPCFSIRNKLRTTGFQRDDAEDWFIWPIWNEAISLDTLRTVLAHPSDDLRARGVQTMYRSYRAPTGGDQGDYRIFSNAEEVPLNRIAEV